MGRWAGATVRINGRGRAIEGKKKGQRMKDWMMIERFDPEKRVAERGMVTVAQIPHF